MEIPFEIRAKLSSNLLKEMLEKKENARLSVNVVVELSSKTHMEKEWHPYFSVSTLNNRLFPNYARIKPRGEHRKVSDQGYQTITVGDCYRKILSCPHVVDVRLETEELRPKPAYARSNEEDERIMKEYHRELNRAQQGYGR